MAAEGSDPDPVFPDLPMYSLDGSSQISVHDFMGQPLLLSFWASWCGPCREELPALEKINADLGDDGFVLLTINMDENPSMGVRFLERYDLDIPVYRMHPQTLLELGVKSLPTNVLIGLDGRPVRIYQGYHPTVPEEIRRLVEEMLAAPADG